MDRADVVSIFQETAEPDKHLRLWPTLAYIATLAGLLHKAFSVESPDSVIVSVLPRRVAGLFRPMLKGRQWCIRNEQHKRLHARSVRQAKVGIGFGGELYLPAGFR